MQYNWHVMTKSISCLIDSALLVFFLLYVVAGVSQDLHSSQDRSLPHSLHTTQSRFSPAALVATHQHILVSEYLNASRIFIP